MISKYEMPKKIPAYIRRLQLIYRDDSASIYHQIVCRASIFVREAVSSSNWNRDVACHDLMFFLEEDVLEKIGNFETQREICQKLEIDLREVSRDLPGEDVENVYIALYDENDLECTRSIRTFDQPNINPDMLGVWRKDHIRLFISHRDEYKQQASELGLALKDYGISSFVAHDTIEPMEKWQHIILKSLYSMEIMLLFITDGFFDSFWTNQEVGVALGRGIPIIPVKMQKCDPRGFISDTQALVGSLDNPATTVDKIYKVLAEKLGQEERIRKSTVQAFVDSSNFDESKKRFERLKDIRSLDEADLQQIIDAFSSNENLHNAYHLTNENKRLAKFLYNKTGKRFKIADRTIKQVDEQLDETIPF
jgi:hypothetical protein